MLPLGADLLRRRRPPLLSSLHVLRVRLPPRIRLDTNIEPPRPLRVLGTRTDTLKSAPLLLALAAVHLGARHSRAGEADALVDVAAGRAGEAS